MGNLDVTPVANCAHADRSFLLGYIVKCIARWGKGQLRSEICEDVCERETRLGLRMKAYTGVRMLSL